MHRPTCGSCLDAPGNHPRAVCTETTPAGDPCTCLCHPCLCGHPHAEHHVDPPHRCTECDCRAMVPA